MSDRFKKIRRFFTRSWFLKAQLLISLFFLRLKSFILFYPLLLSQYPFVFRGPCQSGFHYKYRLTTSLSQHIISFLFSLSNRFLFMGLSTPVLLIGTVLQLFNKYSKITHFDSKNVCVYPIFKICRSNMTHQNIVVINMRLDI